LRVAHAVGQKVWIGLEADFEHFMNEGLGIANASMTRAFETTLPTTAIDTVGSVGYFTSITIGDDGQPVISYRDSTNTDLKVARIKNTAWAPNGWGR
jgi:hypothetical protein